MKRVLVTGGGGFIASYTIHALKSQGYQVVTNMRYTPATLPPYLQDVDIYYVDSRDKVGMRALIETVDGVINLAGILGTKNISNPRDFYENNVFSALNVFDACTEYNIPVVQIAVGNHFETNNYSNSKTAAERDCLMYAKYRGMRGNVVRGLNAFGGGQKVKNTGKIIPTFITRALNNEPLQVYGGKDNCGIMDMIYVKDLASILVDVLIKTDNGFNAQIYEAGTGAGMPVYEIAQKIIDMTGSQSSIEEVPMRDGEGNRSVVVAQNPYPFKYTAFDYALAETISYYS